MAKTEEITYPLPGKCLAIATINKKRNQLLSLAILEQDQLLLTNKTIYEFSAIDLIRYAKLQHCKQERTHKQRIRKEAKRHGC